MVFLEELPEQCPPAEAVCKTIAGAYRIVSGPKPKIEDFWSHGKRKLPCPPTVTECKWRSCSLFLSKDRALAIAMKLPKARVSDPYLAVISISPADGKVLVNEKTTHVDMWFSGTFSLATALLKSEKAE